MKAGAKIGISLSQADLGGERSYLDRKLVYSLKVSIVGLVVKTTYCSTHELVAAASFR